MLQVVVIGGGGHGASVIEAMASTGFCEIAGVIDASGRTGDDVLGIPVIGTDELLPDLRARGVDGFVLGVGSTGDASERRRLYALATAAGLAPVTVVHASAEISPSASLGEGAFVGALAYIGPRTSVGHGAIVNSHASIDHDCSIGDYAHVAPGAVLSGGVVVGAGSHVGTGASVSHGIAIGEAVTIGVGSAVVSDIADGATAYGNPCKEAAR